jgi:hypothetical protein
LIASSIVIVIFIANHIKQTFLSWNKKQSQVLLLLYRRRGFAPQTPLKMMITEVLKKFDDQKNMLQDFMKIHDNDSKAIQQIVQDIATIKRSVSSGTSSSDMMQLRHWAKRYMFHPSCPCYIGM